VIAARTSSPLPERISISEEISGDGVGQDRVLGRRRRVQLLAALNESEVRRIQERELLLDPHREIGRALEGRARGFKVECAQVR
jgi:hypothetical protein